MIDTNTYVSNRPHVKLSTRVANGVDASRRFVGDSESPSRATAVNFSVHVDSCLKLFTFVFS